MAVSEVFSLHGIVNSSTFISQIQNARATTEIENIVSQSAGLPFPLFTGPMQINPGVSFETTQLTTVLGLTNAVSGIVDLSGANTDLLFKAFSDEGRRVADATTSHMRFRMSQAYLSLNQITAGHNTEAVASCYLGTTYDGTNAPLVAAGGVALSGTPTSAYHFVAGPVYINSSQLPGVENVTIDFQRQVMQAGGDGEIYKTFVACQYYSPVVTVRCYKHAWSTYGIVGNALTALTVYLRKVSNTGRVADGTSAHIAFTADTGTVQVEEATGGNNDPSMVTVRCTLVGASSTSEPISVSTASTIS